MTTFFSYVAKTMVPDNLTEHETKLSKAMVLTYIAWNASFSPPELLKS